MTYVMAAARVTLLVNQNTNLRLALVRIELPESEFTGSMDFETCSGGTFAGPMTTGGLILLVR